MAKRANIVVEQIHTGDGSTKPPLAILGNPDYAKGYDVVIHDDVVDISDPEKVLGVLNPHKNGIPGVNLHCAMHSDPIGNPNEAVKEAGTPHGYWFEYLGLQSSAHAAQELISISFVDSSSPITKGLENWTTIHEEAGQ